MPFTKIGKGKYRGPSGKTFTTAQVRLYYSRGGTFRGGRPRKARTKEERHAGSKK